MIANVSPSVSTFDDTYNTLKYANRAKNIKTQVQRNVLNVQYHISNYNQIIANLKNEISDLKTQLSKRDLSCNMPLNNNNNNPNYYNPEKPSFSSNSANIYKVDLKKEENKESFKNNTIHSLPVIFEKAVSELKNHLDEELALKNRVIEQEQEIINLQNFININKNNLEEKNQNNNDNSNPKNSKTNLVQINPNISNLNNTNNIDDIIVLNTEPNKEDFDNNREKDNLLINQNNSVIGNGILLNNPDSNFEFINILKEKHNQFSKIKKSHERNSEKLAEMFKKREYMLNLYIKNGIKDFYFEYLKSILKSHNLKLYIIDNKFKEKFNFSLIEAKEDYISNLENQLKFRDDIFKSKNILMIPEEAQKLKSLEQMKKEYTIRLPSVLNLSKNKNLNVFNSNSIINKKDYENYENDKNSGYYIIA